MISAGDPTHSVKVLDISMDIGDIKPSARRQIQRERQRAAATAEGGAAG